MGLVTIPAVPPTKDKKDTAWSRMLFAAICILSILVSVLILRLQPPRATQSVSVLTSDWEPYVNATAERGGIVGDMVVSVLGGSGYRGEVSFDTWESGLRKVDQGTAFGIFPMVKSASRIDAFEFSDPLLDFRYVLFKRSEAETPQAVLGGDLRGARVGRISGYDYWPELDSSGADFETYPSTFAGFQALQDGEIDFLAESDLVGNATLMSEKFVGDSGEFAIVSGSNPALSSVDSVHFVIRKSDLSQDVMARFNQSLAQYKETERYREQMEMLRGEPDHVVLSGDTLVEVLDATHQVIGTVPPGVSARVLQWPQVLDAEEPIHIKMIDGPLAGRLGYVKLSDVEVRSAAS